MAVGVEVGIGEGAGEDVGGDDPTGAGDGLGDERELGAAVGLDDEAAVGDEETFAVPDGAMLGKGDATPRTPGMDTPPPLHPATADANANASGAETFGR